MEQQPIQVFKDVVVEKGDTPNANGRTYPTEELRKIAQSVKQRYGELRYPQLTLPHASMEVIERTNMTISMERVSHSIGNLRVEEDGTLLADVTLLTTTSGQALGRLLKDPEFGPKMGFRLRGFADFDENNVVTNYKFVAIDAVQVKE